LYRDCRISIIVVIIDFRLLFFQDARRKGAVPLPLTSVSTTLQLSGDVLARLPMLQRCSVAEHLLRAVRAGAADADVRRCHSSL
jgi:hypothetical protein